jgi:hypothetical protein
MKLLVKKITRTNLGIYLRNLLNIKPVHMNIDNIKFSSVSDAFAWRTDNNFITKFKYADILNIFYKVKNSWVELHFYSKNNDLIKKKKINNLGISNELVINSTFLNGLKDYGSFYIYHFTQENIETENIISNRCYLGYSQNKNLYSFAHGNTFAKFVKINNLGKETTNIVKTSFFKNQKYKIQKYFDAFDKVELFFTNPTSKKIKFSINDGNNYILNNGCSIIINTTNNKIINIKSNCLFLRPLIFNYNKNYLDVHHS